jgi:hypothetical protein
MHNKLALSSALVAATLALTGCSDQTSTAGSSHSEHSEHSEHSSSHGSQAPSTSAEATPSPAGTTVQITIKGGKVTPNGDRVKAEVGKPVTLNIDADTAGELHVHSTPEQEIQFPQGTSRKQLTIDKPGIVDVEHHELEQVVVQLEVS